MGCDAYNGFRFADNCAIYSGFVVNGILEDGKDVVNFADFVSKPEKTYEIRLTKQLKLIKL